MRGQDDPKKCTAARMVRLGLARSVRRTGGRTLVLDPFAPRVMLPADGRGARSVTGIDCSWRLAGEEFAAALPGAHRRLPPLLAGNPVNYSKIGMLSTAEALAAALFIAGLDRQAQSLLGALRWGHTFYELNRGLLDDYSRMGDESEIPELLAEYGIAAR